MANVARELFAALFLAWRRLLSALARVATRGWARLRRTGKRWATGWHASRAYLTDTGSVWADGPPTRLSAAAAFGIRAFVAGLFIFVGVALGTGDQLPAAGITILTEILWAVARLSIMLLVLSSGPPRSSVLIAFAAGLAPYAIGVTPLLRLVSLWLSAVLTTRGLRGAGATPRLARSATLWAFGGQAAILLGSLVMRGVITLIGMA